MNLERTASGSLAALLLIAPLASAGDGTVPDRLDVPNYSVLAPGVAAAGPPPAPLIEQLKELGFRTVVNLRAATEPGVAEEKAAVESQGLRYVHVPVTAASFSLEDAKAVAQVLDDAEAAPVLLHCSTSNRVGGVWGVVQTLKGKTPEEAEAEARKAGLTSAAMVEAYRRVAAEVAREQP
jgi:uncharacterized protein (TIGR01244 family)